MAARPKHDHGASILDGVTFAPALCHSARAPTHSAHLSASSCFKAKAPRDCTAHSGPARVICCLSVVQLVASSHVLFMNVFDKSMSWWPLTAVAICGASLGVFLPKSIDLSLKRENKTINCRFNTSTAKGFVNE
jgi:hypothetical protein